MADGGKLETDFNKVLAISLEDDLKVHTSDSFFSQQLKMLKEETEKEITKCEDESISNFVIQDMVECKTDTTLDLLSKNEMGESQILQKVVGDKSELKEWILLENPEGNPTVEGNVLSLQKPDLAASSEEIIMTDSSKKEGNGNVLYKSDEPLVSEDVARCDSTIHISTELLETDDLKDQNMAKKLNITIEVSKDIDILLVGKTGKGKSALGNTLLSRKAFEASGATSSVTSGIKSDYGLFNGRKIKVVDAPGVCDTRSDAAESIIKIARWMEEAVYANPDGYHAVIVVLKYGDRFTDEETNVIRILKQIFGEDLIKIFCILVMTCGDNFDKQITEEHGISFREWCKQQDGVFHELLEECNGRIVLFDNMTKNKIKIENQKSELFTMIDRLQSSGKRYTDKQFNMAKSSREKLLIELKIPALKEKMLKEIGIIMSYYNQMNFEEPELKIPILQEMKEKSEHLISNITSEDKGSGSLANLISTITDINKTVSAELNTCDLLVKEKAKQEKDRTHILKQLEHNELQLKILEEREKREHETHLKEIELSRMKIEETEKRFFAEKEKLQSELLRLKEVEDQKIKLLEMEAKHKQEALFKEFELRSQEIEASKKTLELELQRQREEMMKQKDFDEEKLKILQETARIDQEAKTKELEIKQKEFELYQEGLKLEKEKEKQEFLRQKEQDERNFKILEEKQRLEHEHKMEELRLRKIEMEKAEEQKRIEREEQREELKRQKDENELRLKEQKEKEKIEFEMRAKEEQAQKDKMHEKELELQRERDHHNRELETKKLEQEKEMEKLRIAEEIKFKKYKLETKENNRLAFNEKVLNSRREDLQTVFRNLFKKEKD